MRGRKGNLFRVSQRALLRPAPLISTKTRYSYTGFIQESGAASLPWSLPAPPTLPHSRTPFRWGLSFICPSQPPPPATPASRGRGHSEPLPAKADGPQPSRQGSPLNLQPLPRIEMGGAGGIWARWQPELSQPGLMPPRCLWMRAHALQPFPPRGPSAKKHLLWGVGGQGGGGGRRTADLFSLGRQEGLLGTAPDSDALRKKLGD